MRRNESFDTFLKGKTGTSNINFQRNQERTGKSVNDDDGDDGGFRYLVFRLFFYFSSFSVHYFSKGFYLVSKRGGSRL